ncbi:hypothetical protein ACI2OX_04585 [Bacillus sp. N9]
MNERFQFPLITQNQTTSATNYIRLENYESEGKIVLDSDEGKVRFLNSVLKRELEYAKQVQNDERVRIR